VKENSTIFALMGALTILLVVLVVVLGLRSKHTGLDGYLLYATFEQADGLSVGSPVYLSGVKVGVVEQITLNPKALKPRLAIRIAPKVGVPEESAAMIMSDGILGAKFIKIEPGLGNQMMPEGSDFELVQDSIIIEVLLERIVQSAEAARKPKSAKQTAE